MYTGVLFFVVIYVQHNLIFQKILLESRRSLNEYRYDDVKSKRNDDSFMYVKIPIGQLQQAKQRWKRVVWWLQVRKLQPKIHMRSQAAVILTQQLLHEPALLGAMITGSCIKKLIDQKYKQKTIEEAN
ncbi:Hypothetical_protein [Hexamita inflata]|uniref:Hypothetical_protein n=1 Tax=Hexamita inflata TaxID=28002 RepID=A0AA86NCG2_9EUKA|nr:Hypothetical protein HINF_LOCUS4340 [Hexamita inflata]